jgi:hypothetical protein
MCTLTMSLSFRRLVLSMAMLWALVPQLACFAPDQIVADCGNSGMSHECCQVVVQLDLGTPAKTVANVAPDLHVTEAVFETAPAVVFASLHTILIASDHAPPPDPGTSSAILRI